MLQVKCYFGMVIAFDNLTKCNASQILACDSAELVALCKVIFWKTPIPVRTPKWPPHLIFGRHVMA